MELGGLPMPLRRRGLGMALSLSLVLGACGSSHMNLSSPTTAASTTTSTTVSTTADDGQEPAILAAYRGSLADFNEVEDRAPVDANSPQLAEHMAGAQLTFVMSSLAKLAAAGRVATGDITSLHASVSQYNGTQAVVVSCELDKTAVIDASTKKTITAATNSTELVNALVALQGPGWKVTQSNRVSPGCS